MKENIISGVIKNFSSLILAQLFYKIFTFIMMIVVARFLGPEGFGRLSYCISFVWLFLFIADFGLSDLFIRDVAHNKTLLKKYIDNIITLKIFIGITAYSLIVFLGYRFSSEPSKFWVISILGLSVIFDSFMYFFRCLFRVREVMQYEGILMVIESILKLGIILLAIGLRINMSALITVSLALLAVSIINFLINIITFNLNYKNFSFTIDKVFWLYLLKAGIPFAVIYILSLLNFRINIIMLSLIKGDMAAGWYSADYKILEQFIMVPITLSTVYLPVLSRLSASFKNSHILLKKTLFLISLLSICIILMCYFFGRGIILVIYGRKFEIAANYFFAISLALLPLFIKPIIEKALCALKKQNTICLIYFAGIACNIALNMIFIPRFGINAASIVTFFCEVLVVASCIVLYMNTYSVSTLKYAFTGTGNTYRSSIINDLSN